MRIPPVPKGHGFPTHIRMNNGNGQHETNDLLKQILDIAQNTLETQNIQLEVFQRFDRRMDHIEQRVDRIEQRMDGIDHRLDKLIESQEMANQRIDRLVESQEATNQRIDRLVEGQEMANQRIDRLVEGQEATNQHLSQFITLSDRNFKQADENFTLIAGHLKDISDKLDNVIDLEERMKKVEENVAFLMRKVG